MCKVIAFPTYYKSTVATYAMLKRTERPSVLPENVVSIDTAVVKTKTIIANELESNVAVNFERTKKQRAERIKNT